MFHTCNFNRINENYKQDIKNEYNIEDGTGGLSEDDVENWTVVEDETGGRGEENGEDGTVVEGGTADGEVKAEVDDGTWSMTELLTAKLNKTLKGGHFDDGTANGEAGVGVDGRTDIDDEIANGEA